MQRISLIGTAFAALVLLPTGAGAAECRDQLDALLSEAPDFSERPPDEALLARRTLREISGAALQLERDGHEQACIATLDALAIALTEFQLIASGDREAPGQVVGGQVLGGEDLQETSAAVDMRDPRLVPLTDARLALSTGEIEDKSVFSYDGETVGEFEGLLTGPDGYATHVVIGHGGFWDMFQDRAAIPVELVRWDRERRMFYLPFGEEQLDAAPRYDSGDGWNPTMNDEYYASLTQ